jgi:hypothetical protein
MISTDDGMQIDESDEQPENAPPARRETLDSPSNVIVERVEHRKKHCSAMISTDDGMQIDESEVAPAKAKAPIR